jgi:hypothetical protein
MTMPVDTGRLISALVLLATALFLLSGQVRLRFRRQMRIAAVAIFAVTFAGVAVYVVLWLLGASF